MIRNITVGDTVHSPCQSAGETWLEEFKVKEIGPDSIVLTRVAKLYNRDGKLERKEVTPSEERGDKILKDYYSMPLKEIMDKFRRDNEWLAQRFKDDEAKYG